MLFCAKSFGNPWGSLRAPIYAIGTLNYWHNERKLTQSRHWRFWRHRNDLLDLLLLLIDDNSASFPTLIDFHIFFCSNILGLTVRDFDMQVSIYVDCENLSKSMMNHIRHICKLTKGTIYFWAKYTWFCWDWWLFS